MSVGTITASCGGGILSILLLTGVSWADSPATQPAKREASTHATTTAPVATQPAHPYSGDLLTRSTLTGDWDGFRNELMEKGITWDVGLTQVFQGLVGGGKTPGADYGGRLEANLNLDFQKMGLWPGAFVNVEMEGKFGNFSNGRAGTFYPVDINALFPVPGQDEWAVTAATFAQFVSPQLGFMAGLFDTMSGDMNEFAHGKGDDKFMNMAFCFNPVAAMVPYPALGVTTIFMPDQDILMTFAVLGAEGKANECNFSTLFENGVYLCPEIRITTHFFDLTGHQLFGGGYSTRRYVSLQQAGMLANGALNDANGSWDLYYNFDQYLYEPVKGEDRGWGIFGRFGASDGEANATHFFYSGGLGGKGVLDCRPNDRFGVGYYYLVTSNASLPSNLGFGDSQGLEAFYQIAVTPWMSITPDLQIVQPSQERTSVGYVLGLRMHVDF